MGQYLNNKNFSNSIVLTKVADGKSASSTIIETDYDEILRFENAEGNFTFSPNTLSFRVLDLIKNEYKKNFAWTFSYLNESEYVTLFSSNSNQQFPSYFFWKKAGEENDTSTLLFDPAVFYDIIKKDPDYAWLASSMESGAVVFKMVHDPNARVETIKYLSLQVGLSAEMAQMVIGANSIVSNIQNTSLEFTEDGLSLLEGDLSIYKTFYEIVQDSNSEDFNAGKYYILDNNNMYVIATGEFDSNTIYFQKITRGVFYLNSETKRLTLDGDVYAENGYFKGEVHATSGKFEGTIEADQGSLGGWNITQGALESQCLDSDSVPAIVLDGAMGKIKAKNIDLGGDARVTDKIVFSNGEGANTLELYNPSLHNGKVLQAANISMTNEGRLSLGTLELYGGTGNFDGYICSKFNDANDQRVAGEWAIREDGSAYFRNIRANDLIVENSVLEIDTIQSVGSTMIFKDGWIIKNIIKQNTVTGEGIYIVEEEGGYFSDGFAFDKQVDLLPNDYVLIKDKVYKVKGISSAVEHSEYTAFALYGDPNIEVGSIVTKLGSASGTDCVISVRGDQDLRQGARYAYSSPQAFCFSSFGDYGTDENPNLLFTKHLILGKLSNSGIDELINVKGYGLYADNVYLNGALTTRGLYEANYAGINTLSGVSFNKSNSDESDIVFWGGASGTDAPSIQDALFQVSAKGTLYAQNAILKDSVLVGGTLEATTLKTVHLRGSDALNIHDSDNGIIFMKGEQSLFSISGTQFVKNGQEFISLKDAKNTQFFGEFVGSDVEYQVVQLTEEEKANFDQSSYYLLGENGGYQLATTYESDKEYYVPVEIYKTTYGAKGSRFYLQEDNSFIGQIAPNIDTSNEQVQLLFKVGAENNNILTLEKEKAIFNGSGYFNNQVLYGQAQGGQYLMEFRIALDQGNRDVGYDVYIYNGE